MCILLEFADGGHPTKRRSAAVGGVIYIPVCCHTFLSSGLQAYAWDRGGAHGELSIPLIALINQARDYAGEHWSLLDRHRGVRICWCFDLHEHSASRNHVTPTRTPCRNRTDGSDREIHCSFYLPCLLIVFTEQQQRQAYILVLNPALNRTTGHSGQGGRTSAAILREGQVGECRTTHGNHKALPTAGSRFGRFNVLPHH